MTNNSDAAPHGARPIKVVQRREEGQPTQVTIQNLDPGAPPDKDAWQELVCHLVYAPTAPDDPRLSKGLTQVVIAINAISNYLWKSEVADSVSLIRALIPLQAALADIAQGRRAALFEPTSRPAHAPGKDITDIMLMAAAARAMEELIAAGEGREVAARKVSSALRERVPPIDVSASKIAGWRDRIREGEGSAPELAIHAFKQPPPGDRESHTPEKRAKWFLRLLKTGPFT